MYFPNLRDEWFNDHVICSPQVIFNSISDLILPSLQVLHSSGAHLTGDKDAWEKGQFSIESIERYCTTLCQY